MKAGRIARNPAAPLPGSCLEDRECPRGGAHPGRFAGRGRHILAFSEDFEQPAEVRVLLIQTCLRSHSSHDF